ncbi:MAG: hypothetical protein M3680_21045 [Myxococcota bacterium]|nr:hypothetical protein [Myxococcota bacterium]
MTRAPIALVIGLAITGCGRSKSAPPPPAVGPVPGAATQVITAIVPTWDATVAELRLWIRQGDGWVLSEGPWPGVIGKAGAAWGSGVHGTGAPAGREGPVKREGDGKTPAGVFAVRKAYGYGETPPAGGELPYERVDASWKCVDDPASDRYTSIVNASEVDVDWKTAEDMRRADDLYEWVIDLAHNPEATPGGGSCIFLHVWSGPRSTTVGCTAMAEDKLHRLLGQLDRGAHYVLLPRADYDALAPAWGLPPSS